MNFLGNLGLSVVSGIFRKDKDSSREYFRFSSISILIFYQWCNIESQENLNFGAELQRVVQSRNFEDNMDSMGPFLAASVVAWPLYWFGRGIEWSSPQIKEPLQVYIRKVDRPQLSFSVLLLILFFLDLFQSKSHPIDHNYTRYSGSC